ncbi:MAG TPA: hypothetical protein VF230_06115 [Acidimicrobiales bacterium]
MTKDERGSVLMLVPAAVLVLLVLAAIAIDSAVIFLASRDLSNRTAAVANDVAGAAVSDASFYGGAGVVLDGDAARRYAATAFAAPSKPEGYVAWAGEATVVGDRTVEVVAWAEVRHVFAGAIPGVDGVTRVEARSVATARGGE